MVQAGCNCRAVAGTIVVNGPSMACATISAFSNPVASSKQCRASKMVPIPIVMARRGTRLGFGNSGAFCDRVTGESVTTRVRD